MHKKEKNWLLGAGPDKNRIYDIEDVAPDRRGSYSLLQVEAGVPGSTTPRNQQNLTRNPLTRRLTPASRSVDLNRINS